MRTDNDSWEITESVGVTAVGVAAIRAMESDRPDALFHDTYARKLIRATGMAGWTEALGDDTDGVRKDLLTSFGAFGSAMVARTVYFDDYFAAVNAAGIRQVVILAAGLDARAYRLTWPGDTVLYELDQPGVLEFKARVLADEQPAVRRRTVAADLRHDWPAALQAEGFDASIPTAWLAEGLLRYLRGEDQDRLFENMVALSAPGSRIAVNSGDPRRPVPAEVEQARERLLARVGIARGSDDLAYLDDNRSEPAEWFADHGWGVATSDVIAVLAGRGRAGTGIEADVNRMRRVTTAFRPPESA